MQLQVWIFGLTPSFGQAEGHAHTLFLTSHLTSGALCKRTQYMIHRRDGYGKCIKSSKVGKQEVKILSAIHKGNLG